MKLIDFKTNENKINSFVWMKFSLEISEDNICYSEYFERFNDISINPSLSEDLWIEKEYKTSWKA